MDRWNLPDGVDEAARIASLLTTQGVAANPDDQGEPWIFCCHLSNHNFGISRLGNKASAGPFGRFWLIATRCSFAFAGLQWGGDTSVRLLYADVRGTDIGTGGDVRLYAMDGKDWLFHVKVSGPGILDYAAAFGAFDSEALRLVGISSLREANAGKREFMSLVSEFLREVVTVGSSARE